MKETEIIKKIYITSQEPDYEDLEKYDNLAVKKLSKTEFNKLLTFINNKVEKERKKLNKNLN